MAVLTEELKGQLKEFFAELSDFPVDEVLLQDMIVLNGREIGEYKAVMERKFSIEAEAVESWRQSGEGDSEMEKAGFRLEEPGTHAFKVRYLPHVRSGEIVRPCLSPWRHLHIMWNGETSFCTDLPTFPWGMCGNSRLRHCFGENKPKSSGSWWKMGEIRRADTAPGGIRSVFMSCKREKPLSTV